jgi:hypothetical protein
MKMKIVSVKKARDAIIHLVDVPFDRKAEAAVAKALSTLGDSIEGVSKIVKLANRTNKNLYFDFNGPEEMLQTFFEQYYNHLTWKEVKNEFNKSSVMTSKETGKSSVKKESKKDVVNKKEKKKITVTDFEKELQDFMYKEYSVSEEKTKFDVKARAVLLYDLPEKVLGNIISDASKFNKFLKRYRFILDDMKIRQNPKKFLLKKI